MLHSSKVSVSQELQIVADHFEGGTSFKIWLIDLFKYTFSIWNTTIITFFLTLPMDVHRSKKRLRTFVE